MHLYNKTIYFYFQNQSYMFLIQYIELTTTITTNSSTSFIPLYSLLLTITFLPCIYLLLLFTSITHYNILSTTFILLLLHTHILQVIILFQVNECINLYFMTNSGSVSLLERLLTDLAIFINLTICCLKELGGVISRLRESVLVKTKKIRKGVLTCHGHGMHLFLITC